MSADAIYNHLSQHCAKWQLPEVIFTDAVKRTSVGNADKKRLRAEYERLYLDAANSGRARIAGRAWLTAAITLECGKPYPMA
jgi:acyl-CoA synthetase (AMP-forming)/AMP-acid ligase II